MDTVNMQCRGSAVSNTSSVVNIPNAEEGITVKGSESNQSFIEGSIGKLEETTYTMTFKLVGITNDSEVTRPVYVKTKIECPTCGHKCKSNTKFCPECGTYVAIV